MIAMRYLVVASQLGFTRSGSIIPGGLQQFGRCLVRVLASSPSIKQLGIWSQLEKPDAGQFIRKMVQVYAHDQIKLDVRGFGGNRITLAMAIANANWQRFYDHIMYLLVNQSVLSLLPMHLPYTVWEIGEELFQPLPFWKYQALYRASFLMSISQNTTRAASQSNPGLPQSQVVNLCAEPPLFEPESQDDPDTKILYAPAQRKRAVLIVGSMWHRILYKGHKELIIGWSEVINSCPEAELWIVGEGDSRKELELQAKALPHSVASRILFLGRLGDEALKECYQRCRVFAMPSTGEGFGLVFVEAARYGLPCIGGVHDSVKEIVLDGETGLLVEQDPHEIALACLQLLTDDGLAQKLGNAARQRYLEHFRFQHFRERLLSTMELEY
jgi:glycosyltransferase involved in cell wall biosynthesis